MRILCGGPVSESQEVFDAYIIALLSQGVEMDYKGIDDSPVPLAIPGGFHHVDWKYGESAGDYKEKKLRWNNWRLKRVGVLRNEMRLAAFDGGYDYLFMVDSDMILGPDTLKQLLDADKDIITGLTWTKYKPHWTRRWPNAWSIEGTRPNLPAHVPPTPELRAKIEAGGIHQVEVSGGCYLIKRHVLPKINYGPRKRMFSEDVCLALSAREAGIPIFMHCDVEIEHRRRR